MMRTPGRLAVLLLASWFGAACEPSENPGRASPAYEEWTVAHELTFGDMDDPVYSFGPVRDMAIGPGGRIHTAHSQELLIHRWTGSGELDATFGGRGEGPGEFSALSSIGFLGDTLWALDPRGFRVTYFDTAGTVLRSMPLQVDVRGQRDDPHVGRPRPMHLLPDGTFYGMQSSLFPQIAGRDSMPVLHLHLDADARILDTILVQAMRRTDVLAVRSAQGRWLTGSQPFADGPLTAVEPSLGTLVVVERPAYTREGPAQLRVIRLSMTGDTVFRRDVAYEPVPLEAATVERVITGLVNRWEEGQGAAGEMSSEALTELAREALYTPDYHPPVARVVVGRDGTIWLRGVLAEEGRVEWRVLDRRGEPLGRFRLRAPLRIFVADQEAVWGVQRSPSGVEYVRMFRIVHAPEGAAASGAAVTGAAAVWGGFSRRTPRD